MGASRARHWIAASHLKLIHLQDRVRHRDEYARWQPIVDGYAAIGGIHHPYYAYSLVSLDRLLQVYRPQRILELGSGGTTAVLARYAAEARASVMSIDESSEWLEITEKLVRGVTDPGEHVRLTEAPKRFVPAGDGVLPQIRYAEIPLGTYDFVLVDGPSLSWEGQEYRGSEVVNSNVIELLEVEPPRIIVVDKRVATVEAIRARTGDAYAVAMSDVLSGTIGLGYRYFTVFERVG